MKMVSSNEARKCVVHLLDGNKLDIPLQPKLLTTDLLDIVASHFNLKEKEYFGLCFYDNKEALCWLRNDKKALDHDFPKANPIVLYFRVRNFVESITVLKDNSTVELFFMQARQLVHKVQNVPETRRQRLETCLFPVNRRKCDSQGDLECDSKTVFLLAAYVLQATHGDYVSDAIALGDLKDKNVVPVRTLQEHPTLAYCEEQILEHYRTLDGLTKGEAIVNYLNHVERLPMYGVHYFDVKEKGTSQDVDVKNQDKEQIPWKLGLSYRGIAQYDFKDKTVPRKTFSWSQMENIFYRDKKFTLEYREGPRHHGPTIIKTNSNSSLNRINSIRKSLGQRITVHAWYSTNSNRCREVWHMAVSQHQFFLEKRVVHKSITNQRSLRQMAKHLSKSSTSLSSLRSNTSHISDTASYYFSLDGDSVSSSQMIEAEQDMLAALKARKQFLEQQLAERRELLNDICLREAELTGIVPSELPESPTHPGRPMRRKVGTSFEFDETMFGSDSNQAIGEVETMERDYEIQRQITSAAQRLAMDPSAKKKVRKARQLSYQKSLVKLKTMEQQLEYLRRAYAKDNIMQNGSNHNNGVGMIRINKKDEAGSTGDSLGPIDCETSSSKSEDSFHPLPVITNGNSPRRNRDSMYLATPVITTSSMNTRHLANLKDRHLSPATASVPSPRYDNNSDSYDYTDSNNRLNNNDPGLPPRSYSLSGRPKLKSRNSPASPVARIKRSNLHSSADQLNELTSPRSDNSDPQYIVGEFENTGMYSINIAKRYQQPPPAYIPHSKSSPGIVHNTNTLLHSNSPKTLRRLQQLSLSPSQPQLLPSRYMMAHYDHSQSQSSLASSSELDSEGWSDVTAGEETLV